MNSKQDRGLMHVQQNSNKPSLEQADILIIGNGIAGLTAALEARHLAPDKRIVIITDQIHPTINTPSLKQFAVDKLSREQLLAYPAGTERIERLHVITAHVEAIHAQSKYVSLTGGRGFGYESLLITTGTTPTRLPAQTPGRGFDGVLVLHRLHDYLDLRRRICEVQEAVVIGGGVHAIETVMGLLHWNIRVHWLIRSATLMARVFDQTASTLMLNNIQRAGAIIHTETEVAGIVGRVGAVAGVITNHQEMIPCQLVLCCTGTQPAMSLAEKCSVPMLHKNGIMVDDKLRTSVRDIYAAGDVASLRNPQTGGYETRALWYAAVAQGRVAGAMMVGHDDRAHQPFGVQWHATHLGEFYMLTAGNPLHEDSRTMILTDTNQGGYRRLSIIDDHLVGYLSLGTAQPDSLAIKRIIDEGLPVKNITRALLKGSFDAREYFSQHRSQSAQKILSGQLPMPNPIQQPILNPVQQPVPLLSANNAFAVPPAGKRVDALPAAAYNPVVQYRQPALAPTGREPFMGFEDEISPFTGNLPSVNQGQQPRIAINQAVERFSATPYSGLTTEDFSAFTGNLPAPDPNFYRDDRQLQAMPGSFTESALLPGTPNSRSVTHKLWAYAEEETQYTSSRERRER